MADRTWRLTPSQRLTGWVILIGPYDEGFIEDLKTRIPAKLRSWSPGLRAWRVHESALEDVAAIIERHGTTGGPGPEPDVDTIHSLLSGLGDEASAVDVREALGLVGEPASVIVRRIDGRHVVLAVLDVE